MINFKTKPHRAVSYNEKAIIKAAGSLIAEIKYDGVRGNLVVDGESEGYWSEFCTREGTEVAPLSYLAGEQAERWAGLINDDENPFPQGVMIDGELMIQGVDFHTSSGILRTKWLKDSNLEYHKGYYRVKRGKVDNLQYLKLNTSKLTMVVYDLIPLDVIKSGNDYEVPTLIRVEHAKLFVKLLCKHFPEVDWQSPQSWDVYDIKSLHELYNEVREGGHEGLIVKDPFSPYRRGKRTGMWKMKPECEADGNVTGLVWGTEGLANEGRVIGFEVLLESGRTVNATNISQSLMDEFTAEVKEASLAAIGIYSPYGIGNNEPCYVNPYEGWACQITYMEETPDGSLRHPAFDSFRGTEDRPTLKV